MHKRGMLSNNRKIIQEVKMNVQSSVVNLFSPNIFWMFISEGKLKIIPFILHHHKTVFCNVGFSTVCKKEVLTHPTLGWKFRAGSELWGSTSTSLGLVLLTTERQFWAHQQCSAVNSGYLRTFEVLAFPRSRVQFVRSPYFSN